MMEKLMIESNVELIIAGKVPIFTITIIDVIIVFKIKDYKTVEVTRNRAINIYLNTLLYKMANSLSDTLDIKHNYIIKDNPVNTEIPYVRNPPFTFTNSYGTVGIIFADKMNVLNFKGDYNESTASFMRYLKPYSKFHKQLKENLRCLKQKL